MTPTDEATVLIHEPSCDVWDHPDPRACSCSPHVLTGDPRPVVTAAFILWHRPARRAPWQAVANGPTYSACLDLIGTGDRRGGDWLVMPREQNPN